MSDKLQGNNIANMSQQIRARELEKINKYRNSSHRQRVLAPIASGGLGLNGLQRRSHAGWLCAWSTVLDTFKSNENRHTCNIGVTRYIDDMIKYLDLTETERDHEQQAWLESMEKNTFICAVALQIKTLVFCMVTKRVDFLKTVLFFNLHIKC